MTDKEKERNKNKKAENKKEPFIDDGRTVVNMNVEGFDWYHTELTDKKKKKKDRDKPTKKETFSMIIGAYKAYLPLFLTIIAIFTAILIIFYLLFKSKY